MFGTGSKKWKVLYFGLGFAAGLGVSSLFSEKGIARSVATKVLSYGLAAKRKIETLAELGKESVGDLVAEADAERLARAEKKECRKEDGPGELSSQGASKKSEIN
jgi:hypothetical protein